ncbi:MAG: efflux RND transporter periplasmic adaptor subunit [Synergistaceae bacterium]|nr:efflux RND transporter periplasmic adaptor subunit [Synergistaceae bacterium]
MKISELFSGKGLLIFIIVFLIVASSVAIYFKEKPKEPYVKASGMVEVTQVQLSPLAGGRIEELTVSESDHVKKGQLIARLSMDGADDDLKMAEAALDAARAQLAELESGFRSEDISKARAELSARTVQYEQAKRDAERFAALAEEGVIAARDSELYTERAKASRSAMQAAADQLRLLENGMRPEQIAAARANVARAESALKKARTLVGYKEFYSPAEGVVLTKNYEVGDVINAGAALATIGDMEDCWVKLYIPSTQLGLIKLGAKCSVYVDPFPKRAFEATVTEVNQQAEYNPRMSLTQDERANMVFWIKVSIENTDGVIKPGMPADVTIL